MTYHELACDLPVRPVIRLGDSGVVEQECELRLYGQDDLTDESPGGSLRLTFQLRHVDETYVHVVGLRPPEEGETVESGPGRRVSCPRIELPAVFARLHVHSPRGETSYFVDRLSFESQATAEPDLEARWHLHDAERARAILTYSRGARFRLKDTTGERALEGDERITFSAPNRPPSQWAESPPSWVVWRAAKFRGDPYVGPVIATVEDLLDHALEVGSVRGKFISLADGSSVTVSPDRRHVMTTLASTDEGYGSSSDDQHDRRIEVWNVERRERVLSERHTFGVVDGIVAGTSSAQFRPDGSAVEMLSGQRVVAVHTLTP